MNADFDLLTVQPDFNLSSNGFYDAQALRNNPSFADPFKLRFVRLGTGGATPGAQPYTVYNTDFSTQSLGQTTSVPGPSALQGNRIKTKNGHFDRSAGGPAGGAEWRAESALFASGK